MNENKPQSGTRHASLETLTLPEGHFRQNYHLRECFSKTGVFERRAVQWTPDLGPPVKV
jgi:hypothetical protein